MNNNKISMAVAAVLGTAVLLPVPASAGGTIEFGGGKSVSVGAGLRTSMNSVEKAAPNATDDSSDFLVDSVRLYVNGQIHENIKFTFNTERDGSSGVDGDMRVLDAIAQFEFSDMANVWFGRFLPPSDRSNLDGPYYLNAWNFPAAQAYPAIFAGRDNGIAFWGQTGGGQFKYQAGLFDGTGETGATPPNQKDEMELALRLTYNAWDPEPGYYNSSTYYGEKDILAIGVAMMTQSNALGTTAAPRDFTGVSVDGLFEKKLSNSGVATVEAAWYDYDRGATGADSDAYFVLGSYLFPQKVGIGQLQPMVRFQEIDVSGGGTDTEITEFGLNYIIDGHNARISFVLGNTETTPGTDANSFQIGAQLQI